LLMRSPTLFPLVISFWFLVPEVSWI